MKRLKIAQVNCGLGGIGPTISSNFIIVQNMNFKSSKSRLQAPVGYNPGVLLEADMATPLVECIPNFSEARRPEVIDQIVAAITSVEGARLLDRSSDLDHNRTARGFYDEPARVRGEYGLHGRDVAGQRRHSALQLEH